MSNRSTSGSMGSPARANRTNKPVSAQVRRLGFEGLEDRRLLSSVGLNTISNVTLPAGTSILVALNGSDPTTGKAVNFAVSTSDPTKVAPTVMPQTNKSVQFNINGLGAMTFQLFDNLTPTTASHIETLVNDGFYNGDYIYRAETGSFALIQGGNNPPQINSGANVHSLPSGVPSSINEEFNPNLNYTSAGSLAMARTSTANTSGTEFFVTAGATRSLDYGYTLFGFQTVDQAITYNGQATTVLKALDSMPTTASSGINYLKTPVKINSASVVTDTQNGVLMLRAPTGVTGSYTVTVTAYDGTNTPTTKTFTVNVVADTVTGNTANPWASHTPAAPTSIVFQPPSGHGTTAVTSYNNSAVSKELQFLVSGVTSGNRVTVYADGVAIGSATASTTSVTVTTNGTAALFDGTHTFTATQSAPNVTVTDSGDSSQSETANVDSLSSSGIQVRVVTGLAVTSTPATTAAVAIAYTFTVQTNAPSGDTITVTPGSLPTGMQFTAATQTFSWTPAIGQAGSTQSFSATVTDAAGNSTTLGPVNVVVSGVTPIQIPTNASAGGNVTVSFSGTKVEIYDNIGKTILSNVTFVSTDVVSVNCPTGQSNIVSVVLPSSSSAALPQEVLVQGNAGSTNNQAIVVGTGGANTFTLGGNTITANGLKTVIATVQKLTLKGGAGNDYYTLNSGTVSTSIVDPGGYNTLDFSHDTAGVTVNLGRSSGQAQSIAPWNTTLSITGVINKLIGTAYADVLTGGAAATTEIVGGLGNDTITGGSGDNILLGGGGNDKIVGGPNNNLLIAGSGTSSIYAKGRKNVVFGGSTNYDANDQSLLNLLNQGSLVSYGYSVRRALASSARNSAARSSLLTFQDSGAHDTVFSSGGNNSFVLGRYGTVQR